MMRQATLTSLILSFFALLIGTIGGWLITEKLESIETGLNFLKFGTLASATVLLFQFSIFFAARRKLFFQLIFLGSFGFTIGWVLICLALPVLWISSIDLMTKIIIFVIFIAIAASNIAFAFHTFEEKWELKGAKSFEKLFKSSDNSVDWKKIVHSMKITAAIFIPGIPKNYSSVVSLVIISFMLLGINLRAVCPVFSAFAWGIPSAVVTSLFLQMSGYQFAQARKVRELENNMKIIFKSIDNLY